MESDTSPSELKKKASEAGIRKMPSNFQDFLTEPKVSHVKKHQSSSSTRKVLKRKTESQNIQSARKKRMLNTLDQMKKHPPCDIKVKTPEKSKKKPPCVIEVKAVDQTAKKISCDSKIVERIEKKRSDLKEQENIEEDEGGVKFEDTLLNVNSLNKTPDMDDTKAVTPCPSPASSERRSSPTFFVMDTAFNQIETDKEKESGKELHSDSKGIIIDEDDSHSSASDISSSYFIQKLTAFQKTIAKKEEELKNLQVKHKEDIKEVSERLEKEIKITRFSCKLSEERRLKLIAENETLSSENEKLLSENKKLSSEMQILRDEINTSSLQEENKTLKKLIVATQDLLKTGMSKLSIPPAGNKVSKQLDFDAASSNKSDCTGIKSPSLYHAGSFHREPLNTGLKGLDSKSERKTRESSAVNQSAHSNCSSPSSDYQFLFDNISSVNRADSTPSPSKYSPYHSTPLKNSTTEKSQHTLPLGLSDKRVAVVDKGLSKQAMFAIAEKVRKDLRNEQRLEADTSGQILLGGGACVAKQQWVDYIRKQKRPSLFVKRLAQSVYGHEGLKSRTVGGVKKGTDAKKKSATPSKLDAIVACYQGKLMADHGSSVDLAAASKIARQLISQKMQDEARPPKEKKNSLATKQKSGDGGDDADD